MVIDKRAGIVKYIVAFLMAVMAMGLFFSVNQVHAEDDYAEPYIILDSTRGIDAVIKDANARSKEFGFKVLNVKDDNKVYFNIQEYNKLSGSQRKKVMNAALNSTTNSSMSNRDKARLFGFIEQQDTGTSKTIKALSDDTNADVSRAVEWGHNLGLFTLVSVVLGVISLALVFWLALATAVDVAVIAFPFLHSFVLKKDRVWWVSPDAVKSIKSIYGGDSSGSKGHYLLVYLKSRAFTLIIVALIVVLIITGGMYDVISFFTELAENMMKVFSGQEW